MTTRLACVDIGSTWTKAALVELPGGRLLATRQAPTTPDDVVAGVLAATAGWDAEVRAPTAATPRCSGTTRRPSSGRTGPSRWCSRATRRCATRWPRCSAAVVALRRHLRAEAAYGPGGAGARGVGLVVLSGGVFRHAAPADVAAVVDRVAADRGGAAAAAGLLGALLPG